MNRINQIAFEHKVHKPLQKEITTSRGKLEVIGNCYSNLFKIENPSIIYTDEFFDEVSASLFVNGTDVEINCGQVGFNSEFIFLELSSLDLLKKIQSYDRERVLLDSDLEIKVEKNIRKEAGSMFSLFGKKYLYAVLSEKSGKNGVEGRSNYSYDKPSYNNLDFKSSVPQHESKYISAPVVDTGIPLDLIVIDNILNRYGIVQVVRDRRFPLGLFLELRENPDEVVFNLNGQKEDYFKNIFEPLTLHYLSLGKKIYVDYDFSNLDEINERVFSSSIYKSIFNNSGSVITVEKEKIINREPPHTCAILDPLRAK